MQSACHETEFAQQHMMATSPISYLLGQVSKIVGLLVAAKNTGSTTSWELQATRGRTPGQSTVLSNKRTSLNLGQGSEYSNKWMSLSA